MPVLIAIVGLSLVAGLALRPTAAYLVTGALALLANVAFVWAIADGQGDDPGWIIGLSIAGAAVAFGAAWLGSAVRGAVHRGPVAGASEP